MNYQQFVKKQEEKYPELKKIVEILDSDEKKNFLIYTHDDPDGVVAGAILARYLDRAGHNYQVELPHTFELETDRVKKKLAEKGDEYDALFILDKGTLKQYDELTEEIEPVIVVDHHYTAGVPEDCILYNPEGSCCSGLQSHMLVELVDETDAYDDFLALNALRSDWMLMPLKDMVPDFVEPFYNSVKSDWENLLTPFEGRPTWMEIEQREKTLLLNQIAELYFAISGGGFQYFYGDRDEELAKIDATRLCFDEMVNMADKTQQLQEIERLDEIFELFNESELVEKIFNYFLNDWDYTMELFESATFYGELGETDLYLFTGEDTRLMPMVGSVKLGNISREHGGKSTVMVMANNKTDGGLHFSFRGTDDKIHLGKVADVLSNQLADEYNAPDEITGGGHVLAAEVKVFRDDIEPAIPFYRLNEHLNKLYVYARGAAEGKLSEEETETAIELGLGYLEESD